MTASSDLDLFVVRPDAVDVDDGDWRRQVELLQERATAWTGNDARVLEYSTSEVQEGRRMKDRVLADIVADGVRLGGRRASVSALEAAER